MNLLLPYTHIVNPRLKHTYLTFDKEGNLIVKSPRVSQSKIEALLLQKSAWIQRSREKLLKKKGHIGSFGEKTVLYYLGIPYPLQLEANGGQQCKLHFDQTCFTLSFPDHDAQLFQKHTDAFYRQKAQAYLPAEVEKWTEKMGVSYTKLSFRKTKRQWGSCSGKDHLSLNTMLMKLPPFLIEYVIVHELAHITHKHHQKSFWEEVARYFPNYKDAVAELKTYTPD